MMSKDHIGPSIRFGASRPCQSASLKPKYGASRTEPVCQSASLKPKYGASRTEPVCLEPINTLILFRIDLLK